MFAAIEQLVPARPRNKLKVGHTSTNGDILPKWFLEAAFCS